jgi:hypothetical protein
MDRKAGERYDPHMRRSTPTLRILLRLITVAGLMPLACCGLLPKGPTSTPAPKPARSFSPFRWAAQLAPPIPDFSLGKFLPSPGIPVVDVREEDLQELKTGPELAKAHRRKSFADFWMFSETLYFEEPNFEAPGNEIDGGLLPPKMP